jgi:hypothetical protein
MQLNRSLLIVTVLSSACVMFASPRASAAPDTIGPSSRVAPIHREHPKHLKCIPNGCQAGYLHCHCYFVR